MSRVGVAEVMSEDEIEIDVTCAISYQAKNSSYRMHPNNVKGQSKAVNQDSAMIKGCTDSCSRMFDRQNAEQTLTRQSWLYKTGTERVTSSSSQYSLNNDRLEIAVSLMS